MAVYRLHSTYRWTLVLMNYYQAPTHASGSEPSESALALVELCESAV